MKLLSGAVVMGFAAVLLLVYEWDFDRRSHVGQAVVVRSWSGGKYGQTTADARLVLDGRPVDATLRAWYRHLGPGQQVRILYLPNDPENVVLDGFWQRHYGSLIAMMLFTALAAAEAWRARSRRPHPPGSLLSDEYVMSRVASSGSPTLRIDTAPRLWDRTLDGDFQA